MRDFIVLLVYLLLLPRVFGGSVFVSGTYAGDIRYDVKKSRLWRGRFSGPFDVLGCVCVQ